MKKGISLVLCIVMLFSVFSVCGVAANTADPNDAMYIKSSGFVNGKVTYTVYLRKNIDLTGAVLNIQYDPAVLEPVMSWSEGAPDYEDDDGYIFENEGAYVTKDQYGDENYPVPGIYASGMLDGSSDTCAIGYTSIKSFSTGSSDKGFMTFKFKVISSTRPVTNVKFYCAEFKSSDENLVIDPTQQDPQLFYTHTTSTLNKTKLGSVYSVENGLRIEWEATKGAAGYRVYKLTDGKMSIIDTVPATQTFFIDDKAVANVVSTYTVRAVDDRNNLDSGRSDDVTGVYVKAPKTVTAAVQATGVKLSWTKVTGATSYKIYRREISADGKRGSWLFLTSAKSTATSYVDTEELESGTHYEYTVRTFRNNDKSAICKYADVWYYQAPTVKVASVLGGVKVSWNAVNGAKTYKIYRKYNGASSWTVIGTVKAGTLKFIDANAKTGRKINYAVRAFGDNGSSKYIAKTISYIATPTLKSLTNSANGLTLKWNAVKNATGYKVYRKAPGATKWTLVATVKNTSYTDKNVKSGKVYKYTVRTVYNKLSSGYDTTGISLKYLATPKLTKISNVTNGINVKWDSVSGAASYKVYRKASGQSSWAYVGEVKGTSFTDKNVKNRTTYTYTVKAVSGKVISGFNKTGLTIKRVK